MHFLTAYILLTRTETLYVFPENVINNELGSTVFGKFLENVCGGMIF